MEKKNRRQLWQLILLLLLVAGAVYVVRKGKTQPVWHKEAGEVFGTFFHVTYECDSSLLAEIQAEMNKVDASLSPFNPSSVISRINRNEGVTPDSLFTRVFLLAQDISRQTDGAFDITVAPLVNAWGFGFKHADNISPELIDSLLQHVGYGKVKLAGGRIVKEDSCTMLDCSAIAKGFGSDCVASLFQRKGISNYMIEIGGEIVTNGHNDRGEPWRIGITKPVDDSLGVNNEIEDIIRASKIALATSGNYRNFYYKDGRKYAHTIDPHTGQPVQHSILSSTVIAPNCAAADAYATAFMVTGLHRACNILARTPDIEAYFIYADENDSNRVFMTEGMKKLIDD